MNAVYKYVYDDKIVYIGKTNSSLNSRIKCHMGESKFQPYIDKCQIYFSLCQGVSHTAILEAYLINKYNPILNKSMNTVNEILPFIIPEPEWVELSTISNYCQDAHRQRIEMSYINRRRKKINYYQECIHRYLWLKNFLNQYIYQYDIRIIITDSNVSSNQWRNLPSKIKLTTKGGASRYVPLYSKDKETNNELALTIIPSQLKQYNFWSIYSVIIDDEIANIQNKIKKLQDEMFVRTGGISRESIQETVVVLVD